MPKFCRAWLSVCLVVSPLSAAETRRGSSELHWHSIAGCPSEPEVIRMVEERLGQRLDAPREQSLFFDARLSRNQDNEFEVLLTTEGQSGKGQRTLDNADCGKLAEAAALVIAIAIDPKRASSRGSGSTNDSGPLLGTRVDNAESVATGDALTLRQSATQTQMSTPVAGTFRLNGRVQFNRGVSRLKRWSFGARALIGSGILPRIDLGAAATVGYFLTQSIELRVGAGGLWPQSIDVERSSAGSMSVGAVYGHAGLCIVPWQGSWQSVICTGVDVGALLAEGRNLEREHGATAQFATLIADAGYRFYLRPSFGLTALVSTGIGLIRPEFGIVRNGVATRVYRPDLEVVRFGLGGFWDVR